MYDLIINFFKKSKSGQCAHLYHFFFHKIAITSHTACNQVGFISDTVLLIRPK